MSRTKLNVDLQAAVIAVSRMLLALHVSRQPDERLGRVMPSLEPEEQSVTVDTKSVMTLGQIMGRHCERTEAVHIGAKLWSAASPLRAPRKDGFGSN
jgi:hypothetical protein